MMKKDWIFCEHKMPEEGKEVLIVTNYGREFVGSFSTEVGEGWDVEDNFIEDPDPYGERVVIAWQPLPEPPINLGRSKIKNKSISKGNGRLKRCPIFRIRRHIWNSPARAEADQKEKEPTMGKNNRQEQAERLLAIYKEIEASEEKEKKIAVNKNRNNGIDHEQYTDEATGKTISTDQVIIQDGRIYTDEQQEFDLENHAHWIKTDGEWICSHCGREASMDIYGRHNVKDKYCRRCGYRMDEVTEDGR